MRTTKKYRATTSFYSKWHKSLSLDVWNKRQKSTCEQADRKKDAY